MEGLSMVASFAKDEDPDRVLMFEHYGKAAIRKGKWKLVRLGMRKPWELYDIEKDCGELEDLAEKHPDRAEDLAALWEKQAHRTMIYPRPGGKK